MVRDICFQDLKMVWTKTNNGLGHSLMVRTKQTMVQTTYLWSGPNRQWSRPFTYGPDQTDNGPGYILLGFKCLNDGEVCSNSILTL
jgi:hypothetical protein